MQVDLVVDNCNLATMNGPLYGAIEDGMVATRDGRIAWVGARADAPDFAARDHIDGGGGWLTPALIDCHTHLVHGGNRAGEFEMRLQGASYEEIARAGGGILSTVRATREASEEQLLASARPRVAALAEEGVTTVEVKSGYGLDTANELKMLRVARRLGEDRADAIRVVTTLLAAHALPPEYAGRADDYIDEVRAMIAPLAREGLVDAVDAFCERIGFSHEQTERVFQAAQAHGLPVKLHAEQLSDQRGAQLVARYGGLSADHLEHLTDDGIAAMAAAGTVAVLLPGAYYFLRDTTPPPVAALRAAGVPMAVATDCNPGTSPMTSLLLAMNMACTLWRLTPLEALAGCTAHAARALGRQGDIGTLEVGKRADFALWRIARPADLSYAIGMNPCAGVVNAGVWRSPKT